MPPDEPEKRAAPLESSAPGRQNLSWEAFATGTSTPKDSNAGAVATIAKELELDIRLNAGRDTPAKLLFDGLKSSTDHFRKTNPDETVDVAAWTGSPKAVLTTDKSGNQALVAQISRGLVVIDDGTKAQILDAESTDCAAAPALNFDNNTNIAQYKMMKGTAVTDELLEASQGLRTIALRDARDNLDALNNETPRVRMKIDQTVSRTERLYLASIKGLQLAEKSGANIDIPLRSLVKEAAEEMERTGDLQPNGLVAAVRFREQELAIFASNGKTGSRLYRCRRRSEGGRGTA